MIFFFTKIGIRNGIGYIRCLVASVSASGFGAGIGINNMESATESARDFSRHRHRHRIRIRIRIQTPVKTIEYKIIKLRNFAK